MQAIVISALRGCAGSIRNRWEALLRVERVNTPLANPDTLIYLIPSTIDRVLAELAKPRRRISLDAARALKRPVCTCGCNPYLSFFRAGEQALLEALVLVQFELRHVVSHEEDLAEFYAVVRKLATEEIEAFCGVCLNRCKADGCRFRTEEGRQPVCESVIAI